jgi:hypothetical protein
VENNETRKTVLNCRTVGKFAREKQLRKLRKKIGNKNIIFLLSFEVTFNT